MAQVRWPTARHVFGVGAQVPALLNPLIRRIDDLKKEERSNLYAICREPPPQRAVPSYHFASTLLAVVTVRETGWEKRDTPIWLNSFKWADAVIQGPAKIFNYLPSIQWRH